MNYTQIQRKIKNLNWRHEPSCSTEWNELQSQVSHAYLYDIKIEVVPQNIKYHIIYMFNC